MQPYFDGLGEMLEGDFADMCTGKFPRSADAALWRCSGT